MYQHKVMTSCVFRNVQTKSIRSRQTLHCYFKQENIFCFQSVLPKTLAIMQSIYRLLRIASSKMVTFEKMYQNFQKFDFLHYHISEINLGTCKTFLGALVEDIFN